MSQVSFDEQTGKQLEAFYRTADAVRRRSLVRTALGASPGERILDVGCGPGFYCAELVEEVGSAGKVVGLDSSPQMLELAARRCGDHDNVELHEANATSLPVEDAAFDGAVCVQVLEYVRDTAVGLSELYRVLRPGGRVVIWDVDWATVSWHSSDAARMERGLAAWDGDLAHSPLPRAPASAMRSAGFEGVEMEAHSFASAAFDPDTYGAGTMPIIGSFVPGRNGVSK